ncbi:MAG: hypothetical protein IKW89_00990 [Bacteroidales bacterium]|nr:hypothetical protein [Bacteroidales bacterium]
MYKNYLASDDCFQNIDLSLDPQVCRLSENERGDYLSNALAVLRLNALEGSDDTRIDFRSDVWDFRPFLRRGEKAPNPVLHFMEVPNEMKLKLKFFLYYFRKKEKVKVSTLYLRFVGIKSIIVRDILNSNPGLSFDDITTRMIIDSIESRNLAPYSKHHYYEALYKFYDYLTRVCKIPLLVDPMKLEQENNDAIKKSKQGDTRLPNIPKEVARAIREKALLVMVDEKAEYRYRLVACALIMLFNLGVRIDDLLDFRVDDLKKEATEVNGYKVSYITYFVNKLSRHNSEAYGHTIYASTECVKAFEIMLQIRLSQPASRRLDYLFVYGKNSLSKKWFGHGLYPLYMFIFHPEICTTDKYSEVFTPNSSCDLKPVCGKTLYFPETRQYRVWLCNDLLAKGVSWAFVEEHLKHLAATMATYYARPEERTPEYIAFAENVFETMLVEKVNPIGVVGPQIRESIAKFLDAKKFNVATDFDSIMDVMGDKVSIRAKTGGFCFKTSLVPCAQEKGTDSLLCAYNLCPNVYSFYYNVDYSYYDFKAHIEAYEQNAMKGLPNAATKELVDIKSLIARSLEPQIKQLEEEIKSKGFKSIAEKHPNLIDIVNDISTVKKQIREWKTKKIAR